MIDPLKSVAHWLGAQGKPKTAKQVWGRWWTRVARDAIVNVNGHCVESTALMLLRSLSATRLEQTRVRNPTNAVRQTQHTTDSRGAHVAPTDAPRNDPRDG
jgi:hypothetical protein